MGSMAETVRRMHLQKNGDFKMNPPASKTVPSWVVLGTLGQRPLGDLDRERLSGAADLWLPDLASHYPSQGQTFN